MKKDYKITRGIKGNFVSLMLPALMVLTIMFTLPPVTVYAVNPAYANVGTCGEFTAAVANPDITTIDVTNGFSLEGDVTIDRSVTITSDSGNTINADTHSLIVGSSGDVSLHGSLSLTGTSTTVEVSSGGALSLPASYTGTISATGTGGKALHVLGTATVDISGGTISATDGAYSVLLDDATIRVTASSVPHIDAVYFHFIWTGDDPVDDNFLLIGAIPAPVAEPITMNVGEVWAVSPSVFELDRVWLGSYIDSDAELNVGYNGGDLTMSSATPGNFKLILNIATADQSGVDIIVPVSVVSGFAGGSGTSGDPWEIETAAQLDHVRSYLGNQNSNKHFEVMNHIDLTGYLSSGGAGYNNGEGWVPIGGGSPFAGSPFTGHFNGGGHTISGLYSDSGGNYTGLFGETSGAAIQNVELADIDLTGNMVGGLVGYLYNSALTGCCVTGAVNGDSASGGLVGVIYGGSVSDCYAIVDVSCSNAPGGLVGALANGGTINNCYAAGTVTITGAGGDIGGLVGTTDGGIAVTVNSSYYNSQTSGQSDSDDRGEPRSSSEMVRQATYSGWDFTGVWAISERASYPCLQAMSSTPLPAPPAATGVTVTPETLTAVYGEVPAALTASFMGPAGAYSPVSWSSSNTDAATVDASGSVTFAGAGGAVITASVNSGASSDTVTITVERKTLTIGGSFTANDKTYDGATAAAININSLTLAGIVSGDEAGVTLIPAAAFNDANAGTGKTVRLTTGSTLTGTKAAGYTLSLTGAPTTAAIITKATPAAPAAPILVSNTSDSVTLRADSAYQFRIDGGSWQDSNVFAGLTPSTVYAFTTRLKETANYFASAESAELSVDTGIGTYALTYYANGGTGTSPTGSALTSGTAFTVAAADTFEAPSGKRFKEWNTASDGTGTAYRPGTAETMSSADLELYAIWEIIPGNNSGGGSDGDGGSSSSAADRRFEVPANFLAGKGGDTLTLSSNTASITIPSDMLLNIPGTKDKKAEITIGQGDKSNLPDDVKDAIGDRPLISLSLLIDGKQADWSNSDAPVTVSIPYQPTADERKNPDCIVVWYIDGSGDPQCITSGHYDPATGTVTFDVTHFSDYAVVFNPANFNDVKSGAWYYKPVSFIAAREITTGTGGGNFSPGVKLTRGQFIVMLMKAYGIAPDTNLSDNFSDAGDTYYTGYLAEAKRQGISAGVGGNLFAPSKEITRQEMFTLLYNSLKVIGQLPQGDSGKKLSDFSDADRISLWAKGAMAFLTKTGTIAGSGGNLNPTGTATRAEMAQVLYHLLSE